ncbi:ATP-binding cassette domain-containing protein [Algoriphagus sp. Y33]|uniref:ABC transporter ATP-binding protein n=1 Tax=Algoriphagus sp. Y33 TaxID=2772483 RepID=UPI00177AB184|nr:ABC transporter ATP-binding protein [Algoriphagus sp. Y33]
MIFIRNLDFGYPQKPSIFIDLEWQASSGSVIGLLGKNGTGKSTFLRILAGLLFPKRGEIKLMGENPFDRRPAFLEQVFFISEEIKLPLDLRIESYKNLYANFYPLFASEKFNQILEDFGLRGSSKIGNLSFGQRKKVQIAFALSTGCKLLLFDEPTNGLDIPSKKAFRKIVAGSITDEQTLLISTHQVKDVERLIDRVMILSEGQIKLDVDLIDMGCNYSFGKASEAPPNAVFTEDNLTSVSFIAPKESGEEPSDVNLELLFNAVIAGKMISKSSAILKFSTP